MCRENKRQEVLTQRREAAAPRIVALLPLSAAINAEASWNLFLDACAAQARAPLSGASDASEASMDIAGLLPDPLTRVDHLRL